MPAVITHQLFALEIINFFSDEFPALKDHKNLFMVANQGPDPFFFYSMLPWNNKQDKDRIRGLGSYFHSKSPGKNLQELYIYSLKKNEEMQVYALGALLHYILDRKIHPYVYYRSGFDSKGDLTHPYDIFHSHLETLIDVEMLRIKEIKRNEFNFVKYLKLNKKIISQIDIMYQSVYHLKVEKGDFLYSLIDMKKIYSIIYDRFGIKRNLLGLFFSKNSQAYASSHPKNLINEEKIDVLNLEQNNWKNPVDGKIKNKSVPQLFNEAKMEAVEIIRSLKNGKVEIFKKFDQVDYNGIELDKKMQFKSIFFPLVRSKQK